MMKRLNELSFVIGVFFTIVSIILAINVASIARYDMLSILTAAGFLVFGLFMMFSVKTK